MNLQEVISQIKPVDQQAAEACNARWNLVAKPLGSLGKLEDLLKQTAAITGNIDIDIGKKCVLVFCGDNGVLAQGVAQSTSCVTSSICRSLLAGTASVKAEERGRVLHHRHRRSRDRQYNYIQRSCKRPFKPSR